MKQYWQNTKKVSTQLSSPLITEIRRYHFFSFLIYVLTEEEGKNTVKRERKKKKQLNSPLGLALLVCSLVVMCEFIMRITLLNVRNILRGLLSKVRDGVTLHYVIFGKLCFCVTQTNGGFQTSVNAIIRFFFFLLFIVQG